MVNQHTIPDLIRRMPVFSKLSERQARQLLSYMSEQSFEPDAVIFREGEQGDRFYYVVSGFLDVIKANGSDQEKVLANMGPGESLGEMAIIDQLPRSASAVARSRVTALVLTQEAFDRLVSEEPEIGVEVLKGLARRMSMNLRYTDFLTVRD